jgi:hypothetical protein
MKQLQYAFILAVILNICTAQSSVSAQTVSPSRISPNPTSVTIPDEQPPTGINLTLSPVFLNLTTDPGKDVTGQFRVTNNNNFTESVQIDINKFVSSPDATNPVIQETTDADIFTQWVRFSEDQFELDPNQTKTVRFTISPPDEAALGYYYAFVINRMRSDDSSGQGAAITGAPALPVLLYVKSPNAKMELQVADFKTDKVFYEYLPTEFIVTVKNSGNVHVAPAGNIFIDSMFDKEIAVLSANKGRGNVLPQSEREYRVSWDDAMILRVPKVENGQRVEKDGKPVYTTEYNLDKPLSTFRFGKYTANLLLVYDAGDRDVPIEAQVSFWVIPVRLILTVLAVLFTPVLLVILFFRLRYRRSR